MGKKHFPKMATLVLVPVLAVAGHTVTENCCVEFASRQAVKSSSNFDRS